ncbi:hypothetical protein ACVJGD_004317 [Bradyrhizobium sp. USDA 10063]
MVKDGSALARATSIGPGAATGVSADAAGGIRRYASRGAASITIVYRLYGER